MRFWMWTVLALVGCSGVNSEGTDDAEGELITTVELTITGGGYTQTVRWSDPEADGSPEIDPMLLEAGVVYDVDVAFLNELEDPAEDITVEINDESDQHQVFFTGGAVQGPASASADALVEHAYADTDANGLPVGLSNTLSATVSGTGELVITLQHMPEEDGTAVKTADAAETVKSSGFGALGGDADVSVTFELTVL